MSQRLQELIDRIEAGEPVSQADVDRTSTLIALDLVVQSDEHAQQTLDRQREADELLLGGDR